MDTVLNAADSALRTLFAKPHACRTCPTVAEQGTTLSAADKALAGALMRVNHVGEVCAQALYASQALSTRNPVLREQFLAASKEEGDHLAWTRERLDELGARPLLLLIRPDDVLIPVRVELVETLRQAQGERFIFHKAGSIS